MNRYVVKIGILLILFIIPTHKALSANYNSSPERVAELYLSSWQKSEIKVAISYIHPEALSAFRKMFIDVADEMIKNNKNPSGLYGVLGVKDFEEAKKLSSQEFCTNFLSTIFEMQPNLKKIQNESKYQILGSVKESDNLCHVVYRITANINGANITMVKIQSVMKTGNHWGALFDKNIQDMGAMVRNKLLSQ